MFYQSSSTPPLSEACLQALHASLNAPVVHIDGLPVAPARAVIVVYAEEYGGLALGVGLRPVERGDAVLFRYRDPIAGPAAVQGAIEAAFDFAEQLGFLFDDDVLAVDDAASRRRALQHWNRFMFGRGSDGEPASRRSALADGLAPELSDEELLLDDLADLAGETGSELFDTSPLAGAPPAAQAGEEGRDSGEQSAASPVLPLTKFRKATDKVGEPPAFTDSTVRAKRGAQRSECAKPNAGAGSALGRIPIVRMRRHSDSVRSGLLARLLGSF